jgi:hypothetical protein
LHQVVADAPAKAEFDEFHGRRRSRIVAGAAWQRRHRTDRQRCDVERGAAGNGAFAEFECGQRFRNDAEHEGVAAGGITVEHARINLHVEEIGRRPACRGRTDPAIAVRWRPAEADGSVGPGQALAIVDLETPDCRRGLVECLLHARVIS